MTSRARVFAEADEVEGVSLEFRAEAVLLGIVGGLETLVLDFVDDAVFRERLEVLAVGCEGEVTPSLARRVPSGQLLGEDCPPLYQKVVVSAYLLGNGALTSL